MINYQKKPLLVPISEPSFVRKDSTYEHNEVTVVTMSYAIPIGSLFAEGALELNPILLKKVVRIVRSAFKGIHFDFNDRLGFMAFTFEIKAKTERRGKDKHNQELADKIALAKANKKAANVLKHIIMGDGVNDGLIDYYVEVIGALTSISTKVKEFMQREDKYVRTVV